jgi:membrane fusion protein, multidrug efflux system
MQKLVPLFIVFLFGTLLVSCKEEIQEKQIIRPVRFIKVYSTGGSRVRIFTGVAQAGSESKLSFRVPGTVLKIPVLVGSNVRKGQLISELDPGDYQLQVQQAEAALTQAQAQARNASSNFDRIRSLYEANSQSKSNYDTARAVNESANAAVLSAQKQLELAKSRSSYTRLIAPVNGAIASVLVEMNENVQAGQPIVLLTSVSQIEVKLSIPEVLITQIKEGSDVKVKFDAIPDSEFSATIFEVGVAATGIGTTYPVTVRLAENEKAIRPGMAATVACQFEYKNEREHYFLPSHAVVEDRQGRFVYIVKPIKNEQGFGVISRRAISMGDLTTDGIEIFEGLVDGDMVVTAGVSRINDGMKVKI